MSPITLAAWIGIVAIGWDDEIRGRVKTPPIVMAGAQLALGIIFIFGQAIFGNLMAAVAVLAVVASLLGAMPVVSGK
jgi:hypothetical protein